MASLPQELKRVARIMSSPTNETKEEAYDRVKEEAKQIKSDLVKDLSSSDRSQEKLQDRLYRMIDYAIARYDWYDEQRYRFLRIGLGITAAASALASLLVNISGSVDTTPLYFFALSVFFLLATGVLLIIFYNRGVSKDHPYRKIADIRSWYFVYNQPEKMKEEISKYTVKAIDEVENVKRNLRRFAKRWIEYAKDEDGFLKEDIEQVFILHLIQRYKSQQVKRLSNYLTWGISLSAIIFFVGMLFSIDSSGHQNGPEGGNEPDSTNHIPERAYIE